MKRLDQILGRLEEIKNEPFTNEKINEMVKLNREKNDLLVEYHKKYTKAYQEAGTNKTITASFN